MGLFDNIICEYPLPGNPIVREWQTKDTPSQYLDTYVIAADGAIYHKEYDYEDQSDFALGKGEDKFLGSMARINQRLVPMPDYRGCINFYGDDDAGEDWEFSALFDNGKLLNIKQISPADSAGLAGGQS